MSNDDKLLNKGNWKYGVFYYNKNDFRLLVEKKYGWGWTLNFANKKSYLVIGALFIFILFSILLPFFGN